MKIKSCYKYILRLLPCVLVAALLFSFAVPAEAHALGGSQSQRFAAMVGAALTALNITLQSVNAPLEQAYNYLSDPAGVVYTYSEQNLHDYFDRSTIQIWPDYTEIDGVTYTDVWLSSDAATKFRVDAGDFRSAYSIASNTNGTYASGAGFIDGLPAFVLEPGTAMRTQTYGLSEGVNYVGDTGRWDLVQGNPPLLDLYNRSPYYDAKVTSGHPPFSLYYSAGGTYAYYNGYTNPIRIWSSTPGQVVYSPFEFDYVAGTIPADPAPGEEPGLMFRVPSDTTGLQDFIDDHPSYSQPGGSVIDIQSPGVDVEIDDLIDILAPIVPVVPILDNDTSITYADNHTEPVPPSPSTIADTDYSILQQALNTINNSINNIAAPIVSSISTGVTNILEGIGDLVDRILEDIEIGPIKVFDKVLDIIKSIFVVPLNLLRSAVGIWSYVVNWLSGISAPVTWFLAIVGNSMSLMLSPVYACVAGAIVISIYKRFGR